MKPINLIKPIITILIFFCYLQESNSQTVFKEGYFINNDNQKIDCLIKDRDWMETPSKILVKHSIKDEVETKGIESIKEFGINGRIKYIRSRVKVDKLSNNALRYLSTTKEVQLSEETIFLKVLVEGNASLYSYKQNTFARFFYKIDESPITQLIYKKYKNDERKILENNEYRQQLLRNLRCEGLTFEPSQIQYFLKPLILLIEKYNKCKNADYTKYEDKKKNKLFRASLKIGYAMKSFPLQVPTIEIANYKNLNTYKAGLSAEFIFPFINNKWSVIAEPMFQSMKLEETSTNLIFPDEMVNINLNYQSIELSIGIRNYFFLNQKSTIYLEGLAIFDFPLTLDIEFANAVNLFMLTNGVPPPNYSIGTGFQFKEKYSIGIRFDTKRNILYDYDNFNAELNGFTIVLGFVFL